MISHRKAFRGNKQRISRPGVASTFAFFAVAYCIILQQNETKQNKTKQICQKKKKKKNKKKTKNKNNKWIILRNNPYTRRS